MFELCDFYNFCQKNDIDIIPFPNAPSAGVTIRDGKEYAIFLDFAKIQSTRLLKGVCCHEIGHAASGALHKVSSPYELVERSEYRANRWVAQNFLTEENFRVAFASGYTELWQLADYFDLPEDVIRACLSYWIDSRGINFNMEVL